LKNIGSVIFLRNQCFFYHFSVSLQVERIILRLIEHFCIRAQHDGTSKVDATLLTVNGKSRRFVDIDDSRFIKQK
jgi:hypothetical protein